MGYVPFDKPDPAEAHKQLERVEADITRVTRQLNQLHKIRRGLKQVILDQLGADGWSGQDDDTEVTFG